MQYVARVFPMETGKNVEQDPEEEQVCTLVKVLFVPCSLARSRILSRSTRNQGGRGFGKVVATLFERVFPSRLSVDIAGSGDLLYAAELCNWRSFCLKKSQMD